MVSNPLSEIALGSGFSLLSAFAEKLVKLFFRYGRESRACIDCLILPILKVIKHPLNQVSRKCQGSETQLNEVAATPDRAPPQLTLSLDSVPEHIQSTVKACQCLLIVS
jgi:hypothetical protein